MGKNNLMMIIIIVLLVVLLATVGGVAFYVLNLLSTQSAAVEEGSVGVTVAKDVALSDQIIVVLGDNITTNFKTGADGKSHLGRVKVSFGYDETAEKDTEALTALFAEAGMLDVARSVVLDCINNITYEEVQTPDGKAALADTIKAALQEEFNTPLIVDVYFGEWALT